LQLFDKDNPLNKQVDYLFSTEGHIFPLQSKLRKKVWEDDGIVFNELSSQKSSPSVKGTSKKVTSESHSTCSQAYNLALKQFTGTSNGLNNDVTEYIAASNKTFSVSCLGADELLDLF